MAARYAHDPTTFSLIQDRRRTLTYTLTFDHIALTVHDASRTATLLGTVFNAKTIRRGDDDGHDETYLRVGGTWFVLVAAEVQRPLTSDHIAFHTTIEQMQAIPGRLKQIGHIYQMASSDATLYFTDFDNHVFEISSTDLEVELAGTT